MVNIVKNAKNPKYWSNVNIIVSAFFKYEANIMQSLYLYNTKPKIYQQGFRFGFFITIICEIFHKIERLIT
ncbi:hypothetical protein GCM10007962_23540 [Yeosuana aromativorans]|uniref:Uncharacterized protein n=1 Tax=Yeosuana aromativorans TaxID=288019 RepID=A0A8J3BU67_9FLAO|nr:hypothetical protein GCM10007962_23540 [Yeosuana aromativorans]